MGSLIEYLKKKTAVNVLLAAQEHAKKVQECVRELEKGIKILIDEKDLDKAHDVLHNVDLIEGEADEIRRNIHRDISKGELNPSVRTDLAHLVKYIDQIANCACGVSRRVATVPMTFWDQSSPESIDFIVQMMTKTVECVSYLDKIVIDLLEEREHIMDYAKTINQVEHQIDLLNINLRRSLQATDYNVNAFTIFTVGNIIDIIEAISDSIETVADYIVQLLNSSRVV